MVTRRQFLRVGLLGGASLLLSSGLANADMGDGRRGRMATMGPGMSGAALLASARVAPFQAPLPIPPVLAPVRTDSSTDHYVVTMKPARVRILPDLTTTIWGYEGLYPGPTIKARSGRRVAVRQVNQLPESTTVHLHGGHVAPEMDGHPTDYIAPGASKDFEYPNSQPSATLWYHDHTMSLTGPHVYRGLAGFYLIEDEFERSLPLPRDAYDVPLVIQDKLFGADGSLVYSLSGRGMGGMMGGMGGMGMMGGRGMMGGMGEMMDRIFLGDTILVNGAVQPYFQVAARKYRFRILNGSNAREYDLVLSTNQPFIQVGTEGGLLPAPASRTSLYLVPAERVDVVVDFSQYPVGAQVVLRNRLGLGPTADVMRFDVVRREPDDSRVPPTLRPLESLSASEAAATRSFALAAGMMGIWTVNGQTYSPTRVDASPRLGDVEVWQFVNRSSMAHPMHVHDVMWQVLDRNGAPPPAWERGWKDTFVVPAMGTVRVIARFTDYRGLYVFHCHILEHEDRGMMAQFRVV